MKVKGITRVEIEIDPQSIKLSDIELTKLNIEEIIYDLYKRIGLDEYIEIRHGYINRLYYDKEKNGIYYQGVRDIYSFGDPDPILVTDDEKIIELYQLANQLEEGLEEYINETEKLREEYKLKKSMR